MAKTAIITHQACFEHLPPAGHPESPERLLAVQKALQHNDFASLNWCEAPLATELDVARVHPMAHIRAVTDLAPIQNQRAIALDPDTYLSVGTLEAAGRAAGAVIAGVDGVMNHEFDAAFCATRPPGHHAEPNKAMGFCIWNSAAIGALYARAQYGLRRVAVVDFDVHHGNGSQEIAQNDPDFFYASIHQGGIYPGSGYPEETAFGNLVNVAMPEGTTGVAWRKGFSDTILPALAAFKPEFIIVSAGFDGHKHDPLAGFLLDAADYKWVTMALLEVAGGKLVSTLEGGYDLSALGQCVAEHVRALQDYGTHAGGVASRD